MALRPSLSFVLIASMALGCDDDVAPRALDLALGADRACFLGAVTEDTGASTDAGSVDAGIDAGADEDAGTPEDGGTLEDAGVPEIDAGVPEIDASVPEIDAGLSESDAGTGADAGPSEAPALGAAGIPFCWGGGSSDVVPLPNARPFVAMALGAASCGLESTGALACWGANGRGQLGDGTTTSRPEPQTLAGVTAYAFDVSRFAPATAGFACALSTTGALCWGANERGQLGDGSNLDRSTPSPVAGPAGFLSIALGRAHACAVDLEGHAQCWGANDRGQLGDGTLVDRLTPTVVPGLEGVAEVATGADHTCARLTTGAVHCWGASDQGQAGTLVEPVLGPRAIELEGATQLAAGALHTCAIDGEARVRCWGANASLQAGNGVAVPQTAPVTVAVSALRIAAGVANTCALNLGGSVLCWGASSTGLVGSTTDGDTAFPTRIPGTP
ncbi:MAG: hypothetical protein H6723_08290 [Sandaracinus sp.]|nr:hypothetical protein [Sandaracinus sp.]